MKKNIVIIIVVVAIILASVIGGIAYFVISDLKQEEQLKTELAEISELVNTGNIDFDQVNKKLNTIITKNDYAVVEQACKEYLSDNFKNIMEMAKILNDENITNSLTASNYKEDGPDFIKTKKYLSETMQKLEECKNKYYDLLTEEKAMSYINNKNLDNYYTDFYKDEIIFDIETERNDKTVENSLNDVVSLLDNSEKIIDFLIENKGKWQIEGDNIVFNSETLSQKYNELIDNL